MTYKPGTRLIFKKQRITFIQLSTKRFNTREVLRTIKVKG